MTQIPEALDSNKKVYTPDDLEMYKLKGEHPEIFSDLHCKYCGVQLEFRQGSDSRVPYFSTWRNKEHSSECPVIQRTMYGRKYSLSNIMGLVKLSSQDKLNKRDYLYKVLHSNLNSNNSHVGKRNIGKEDSGDKSDKLDRVNQGSLHEQSGDAVEGQQHRSPRTKHVSAGDLNSSDVGKTLLIYGNLVNIELRDNSAVLTLTGKKGSATKVFTSPDFFNESRPGLKDRFESLSKLVKLNKPEAYLFVEVQFKNKSNEVIASIYNEDDVGLPKESIVLYLFKNLKSD